MVRAREELAGHRAGGVHRDDDGQADRAAELLEGLQQAGGGAGVLGGDAGRGRPRWPA